jgi:hypothetical protein
MNIGTNDASLFLRPPSANDSPDEPLVLDAARNARRNSSKSKKRLAVEPTRALSAFELFCQAECARIEAADPNVSDADIFQQIGKTWWDADPDTKAKYVAKYVALHSTTSRPKKRKTTDPNAPKRACSTFMLFSQVERASIKSDHPQATRVEIFKLLGEKWQATEADSKAKYAALYAENKVKADAARQAYADAPIPTAPKSKKKDPNAPKRACSTFMLFSKGERDRMKAEHPTATHVEIVRRLGEKWTEADAETKAKYAVLYAENKVKADAARQAYADPKSPI